MSDPAPSKRPKGRSPAYPSINLERAIQRAEQVYKRERQFPVSVSVIPGLWGYKTLNGPAAQQLSALLKFGLLDGEGSKDDRQVKVADLAVKILSHPDSDERQKAIQQAALLPSIHQEMWAEYGAQLPSDSNLLWRLTRERGFTDTGAKEFIREWRETMQFAGLDIPDTSEPDVADETESVPDEPPSTTVVFGPEPKNEPRYQFPEAAAQQILRAQAGPTDPAIQQYPIPIALQGRPPIVISGAFPLSEVEWAQFTAVLNAMKPVLVAATAPGATADNILAPE